MMSILAVLHVAQAYSGPHNVMSPLPSRMLVDDRYATMASQQRLVLTMSVYVCEWCTLLFVFSLTIDCGSLQPCKQQTVGYESLTPTQGATQQSVDCESLTPTQGAT